MLPAGQKNKFRRSDVALAGNNIASSSAAATSDDQAASSAAGTSIRPRSPTLNARPRSSSARASAGPADGQSSDAGGGKSSKLKKPRKKGWKGYSMQYIDTDGNIIEERPRDETPPEEPTAEEKALALAAAAADYGDVEMGTGSSSVPNGSREASAARSVPSDPAGSKLTGTQVNQPPSVRIETTGPTPVLVVPSIPRKKSTSARAESPPSKSSEPTKSSDQDKDKPRAKKRRKTHSVTPQPPDSRGASTASRPPPANGKGKARASLPNAGVLTARQLGIEAKNAAAVLARGAREAREAASGRTTPYIVDDDTPLPKVPRKGMGDGDPTPPQSNLREEAAFIIAAADKRREERLLEEAEAAAHKSYSQKIQPATPPLTGEDQDMPTLQVEVTLPNGNGDHTTSYRTPAPTSNGFPDPITSPAPAPSAIAAPVPSPRKQHVSTTDEEFAAQFESLQKLYSDQVKHTMPVFMHEPKPPRFHEGQRPMVILEAPQGRMGGRIRDKHERAYLEGFDGLPEDYEREIVGFIDNVRSNMKTVVQFYFDHPTLRRDAFIERLGRELSILGTQLTNDGEAAVLQHRLI